MNTDTNRQVRLPGGSDTPDAEVVRGDCDPCPVCGRGEDVIRVYVDRTGIAWCPCGTVVAFSEGEDNVKVIHTFNK